MSYKLLIFALLVAQIQQLLAQNVVNKMASACAGKSLNLDCTSTNPRFNNTIFLDHVIKGVRTDPSQQCKYSTGDCYEEDSDANCPVLNQKCSFMLFSSALSTCSHAKYEYIQARYSCVPDIFAENEEQTFDICSSESDITSSFGIITSPGYPNYTQASSACVRKLVAPPGKSFKVWISKIKIKAPISYECTDYLKISDSTGLFEACGTQQPMIKEFCSNEIYLAYKAPSSSNLLAAYSGFKLYYETIDVEPDSGCSPGLAEFPTEPTRTSVAPTTFALLNFHASPVQDFKLCKGEKVNMIPPTPYHAFYLEEFNYGVSASNSSCPDLSSLTCMTPQASVCTMSNKCTISFTSNVVLPECGAQNAKLLFGTYRYIPIDSLSRAVVCQDAEIDGDSQPNGVITSRSYPIYENNVVCQLNLKVSDPNKVFKFYITDINIAPPNFVSQAESRCEQSYVRFSDLATSRTFCNYMTNGRAYSYTSCSNQVTLSYKTNSFSVGYKGFRVYYEVVNKEFECPEVELTSSTRQTTTTTSRDNQTFYSSILTTSNQKCETPFMYQSNYHHNCISSDSDDGYWCSVSGNADLDGVKSKCKLGLTEKVDVKACVRQNRKLECPKDYVIAIMTSEYVVTDDGTCDGTPVCTFGDTTFFFATCAGKNKCTAYLASTANPQVCPNVGASSFARVKFTCMPEGIASLDVCGTDTVLERSRGFITSPSYPSTVNSRACMDRQFTFGALVKSKPKPVTVYRVSFAVGTKSGQNCTNSFAQINDGDKMCGNLKNWVVYQGCSSEGLQMSFYATGVLNSFKFYYEVDETGSCDEAETTSSDGHVSEADSTTAGPSSALQSNYPSSEVNTGTHTDGQGTTGQSAETSSAAWTSEHFASDKVESSTWEPSSAASAFLSTDHHASQSESATSEGASTILSTLASTESQIDVTEATSSSSSITRPATTTKPTTTRPTTTESIDPNNTVVAETQSSKSSSTRTTTKTTTTLENTTTTPSLNWTLKAYLVIIIPSVISSILTGLFIFFLIKFCCKRQSNKVTPSNRASRRRRQNSSSSSIEMEDY